MAELRGCDILVLKPGPIPGGFFFARGLDAQHVLETGAGDAAQSRAQAQAFIAARQCSYAEAEPDTCKNGARAIARDSSA